MDAANVCRSHLPGVDSSSKRKNSFLLEKDHPDALEILDGIEETVLAQ